MGQTEVEYKTRPVNICLCMKLWTKWNMKTFYFISYIEPWNLENQYIIELIDIFLVHEVFYFLFKLYLNYFLISNLNKWYRYINKMKYQEWKRDVSMNFRHELIMTTKISPSFLKMILNIKSSRCRNDDHDKQDMLWNISLFIYASRWKM